MIKFISFNVWLCFALYMICGIAPAAYAVDSSYTLNPGDDLQITVWKEANMDREIMVLPDGTIAFPLVGSIVAQGKTSAQLQELIKDKLASSIPNADVTVVVRAPTGNIVDVIGQVNKPGEVNVGHRLTVMQALSIAGGLTPYAAESKISILHRVDGKETSIPFPYDAVSRGEQLEKDILLSPGDVVVVPAASLF